MKRLALKTFSYGILHMAVAINVAYLISGDWFIAFGIGLIEPFVQTGVFAVHDWLWEGRAPSREQMVEQTFHTH
ncbi:MAG: hypothetical protein CMM93_06345 [Rickettsiales bacterium]|nr:hypothetical protein [Rickettsiales bacterium]|tara:strand:- start:69 stop:290 length:222 start_codon:yes stop_codon:yes gene_type:complete